MGQVPCHIGSMFTALFPAFLLTALLIELTPGPNMAWLALTGASDGKRAGLAAVAGIAVGLAALGTVSAFGLPQIASASPVLFNGLQYAGVLYLVWLARNMWSSGEVSSSATVKMGMRPLAWFRHGLLLNLLNPKAAVFFITVVPSYIMPERSVAPQTLALSASYVAIATAIHVLIVMLAAQAHRWLAKGKHQRTVRRVFAVMLAGIAAWFLIGTR